VTMVEWRRCISEIANYVRTITVDRISYQLYLVRSSQWSESQIVRMVGNRVIAW